MACTCKSFGPCVCVSYQCKKKVKTEIMSDDALALLQSSWIELLDLIFHCLILIFHSIIFHSLISHSWRFDKTRPKPAFCWVLIRGLIQKRYSRGALRCYQDPDILYLIFFRCLVVSLSGCPFWLSRYPIVYFFEKKHTNNQKSATNNCN